MPRTASRSSTVENRPRLSRRATMRFAMAGPTPGKPFSSASDAELMSIFPLDAVTVWSGAEIVTSWSGRGCRHSGTAHFCGAACAGGAVVVVLAVRRGRFDDVA